MLFQILCFILFFCASFLYLFFRRTHKYWQKRGIPYEEPLLFFGNLSFIMRKSFSEFYDEIRRKHQSDYVGIFLGWKPALVIQSPELAKNILVKDTEYFQNRFMYSKYESDPLGSLNLFSVKNPIWSIIRYKLTPMFTSSRLKKSTELINLNSLELIKRVQREFIDKNKQANLKELFTMYTSDNIAYSVFGIRMSVLSDQLSPVWCIARHMVKWTFWRSFEFTMIFYLPAVANLLRLKAFSKKGTEYLKNLFWNVARERKTIDLNSDTNFFKHLLKLKDNLKLPVNNGPQFIEDLIVAQAAVFIIGTIETTSTTMSYCLHELAHHPEKQELLYEEIHDALKRSGKDVLEYEDLLELKYLTACLYETLRKYPPMLHLDRFCNKTYKLTEDVTIEAGTPVFINLLALHRDERFHPEPEQWRPERMIGVSSNDNLQFTFLPFGEGPRICLGKRYGMVQMRAALAQIVHNFKLEPATDEPYVVIPDPYSVLLAPKSGLKVTFSRR